jgi:hypothetical protein
MSMALAESRNDLKERSVSYEYHQEHQVPVDVGHELPMPESPGYDTGQGEHLEVSPGAIYAEVESELTRLDAAIRAVEEDLIRQEHPSGGVGGQVAPVPSSPPSQTADGTPISGSDPIAAVPIPATPDEFSQELKAEGDASMNIIDNMR